MRVRVRVRVRERERVRVTDNYPEKLESMKTVSRAAVSVSPAKLPAATKALAMAVAVSAPSTNFALGSVSSSSTTTSSTSAAGGGGGGEYMGVGQRLAPSSTMSMQLVASSAWDSKYREKQVCVVGWNQTRAN